MSEKEKTSQEKFEAQQRFCKEYELPMFADKKCYSCGRDIWERISYEKASTSLITGCPFCCRSYCE